jgi:ABC-type amino acid transport substrate-binding protein
MFHVPIDREFIARNQEAHISNSYHYEETVVAVHPDMVEDASLEAFKSNKIAVQFSTAGHYFLTFAEDGAFRNNISPYSKFDGAAEAFIKRAAAGLMGERSKIENALKDYDGEVTYFVPEIPANYISAWNYGTAVHTDGRDVGYTVGRILRKMRASGEMAKIFEAYGVSLRDPPVQRRRPR